MATLIKQVVTKMGLYDYPNALEKTSELVRLLDLKSSNIKLQINDYSKIVLCADIASTILGIAIDKEQSLKLSALRKSHYANHKRMIEKLLDINKLVGVNDICIQLSLNEVQKKAEELLDLYRKVIVCEQNDLDDTHPQYAAMAVFMACKLCQRKVAKTKLMPFSNLKPTQWQQLEQRWEKLLAKHYKNTMNNKLKVQDPGNNAASLDTNFQKNQEIKRDGSTVEDYENWKKRMLASAEATLRDQSKIMLHADDKGNEVNENEDLEILGY